MSKRIVKVAKELNKDIKSLVNILAEHGIYIAAKPTSMVSDEMEKILYKTLNLEFIPKPSTHAESELPSNQSIGFKSIDQVSKELKISKKTIVRILAAAGNNVTRSSNPILSSNQIEIVINNRLELQKQISKKDFDCPKPNKNNRAIKIIKDPLTKTASRKKRKMEEIARQEREAKAIRFFTGTFRSLATKNPKGHVGFLGNIWPVKK